jgi:uncharacterized membrane protein HdeD (DUF308 family)
MGIAKRSLTWSIVLSVLIIGAGLVAIIFPIASGVAAAELLGALFIFSGVVHVLFGRHALGEGGGFVWELLLGVVYGATGIYLLLRHDAGIAVLTVGLVTYLGAEAGLEFVQCWRLRQLHGVRWVFFDSILTLVIAVLIWMARPSGDSVVIGALIGISMIFSGISRLMLVLAEKEWKVDLA